MQCMILHKIDKQVILQLNRLKYHNKLLIAEIVEGVRHTTRATEGGPNPVGSGGNSAGTANYSGNGSGCSGGGLPGTKNLLRPLIDKDSADEEIISMMTKCWSEDPLDRPDFSALKVAIRKLNK